MVFNYHGKMQSTSNYRSLFSLVARNSVEDVLAHVGNLEPDPLKRGEFLSQLRDTYGRTLLHAAVRQVTYLLREGANPHTEDPQGLTPLHVAVLSTHTDCLKLLLECPNIQLDVGAAYGCTPTMLAATHGHTEALREFLHSGSRLDICDSNGRTALHLSAAMGRYECLRELLLAGADPHSKDVDGNTPLHLAARKGSSQCFFQLLDYGVRPHIPNKVGYTALDDLRLHGADSINSNYLLRYTTTTCAQPPPLKLLCKQSLLMLKGRGFNSQWDHATSSLPCDLMDYVTTLAPSTMGLGQGTARDAVIGPGDVALIMQHAEVDYYHALRVLRLEGGSVQRALRSLVPQVMELCHNPS